MSIYIILWCACSRSMNFCRRSFKQFEMFDVSKWLGSCSGCLCGQAMMENLRGEMFSPAKTLAPWSVTKYEYSIYCTNQIIANVIKSVY